MHQIPGIFRLHHICERWHGRPIHAGHEDFVQVLIRPAALRTVVRSEIVWPDWLIVAVGQGRRRRSVSPAFLPMALPAFQLLEKFLSMFDAANRQGWFRWNLNRIPRLFRFPPR